MPLALVIAACAWLASGFLIGTPPDEEEFRHAVLTSWLHVRALSEGNYAFWTSLLGFGLPQPFIPNFWLHPLLPLLAVLEPSTWIRVVLLAHAVLGATGMWHLCRLLHLRPMVRAVCVATFLLSAPSINYTLTDAWPSQWIAWTSMPWVIWLLWRVLDDDGGHPWLWGTLLGLGTGLVVANDNPACAIVYAVVAAAVLLARGRDVVEHWHVLGVSALIALAVIAPNAAVLVSERRFFASGLRLQNNIAPLPLSALWDAFLRPSSRDAFPYLAARSGSSRTLFFGGPFALLTLVACIQWRWHRRELVIGLLLALTYLFTTLGPIGLVSQRYQFRDPVVLCAIPLAGIAAERGLQHVRLRTVTAILLVLQTVVVFLSAYPFLGDTWDATGLGAAWFRGATAALPPADTIVSALIRDERVLYSPNVDRKTMNHSYLTSGLNVNSLAYRGIPVVNGWFKGVSAEPIWPDERLFYSRIAAPPQLIESQAGLDVLGIRYVLAERGEKVAANLRPRPLAVPTAPELVLYENDEAWPDAFIVDSDDAALEAPRLSGCMSDSLLCRDLSGIARLHPQQVGVTRSEGAIDVRFDRAAESRTLVLTEMFRPAWTATAGTQRLSTLAFLDSLLAVRIPGGATSVHLSYRPRLLSAATLVAWAAIAGSLLVVATALIRARRAAHAAS